MARLSSIILICKSVVGFCKKERFNKLFKTVLKIASIFTFICLIYVFIVSFMETHKAETVFEKYDN